MSSNVEMIDQVDDRHECPKCGNCFYHLSGVYKQDSEKYTHVLTVLECESCLQPYGVMNSYGKGIGYRSHVIIRSIEDWVQVI